MKVMLCGWEAGLAGSLTRAGLRPDVTVCDYDLRTGDVDRDLIGGLYHVTSFDSISEVCALAETLRASGAEYDHVLANSEFSVYGAGLLTQLLGVRADGLRSAQGVRDKRVMKSLAAAAGVTTARFAELPREIPKGSRPPLPRPDKGVGFPLVLKPVNGMGSEDTYLLATRSALSKRLNSMKRIPGSPSLIPLVMAESFSPGEEYHVDAVWRDGRPQMFVISRYFANRIDSVGTKAASGSMVLPDSIYPDLYRVASKHHLKVNRALGIRDHFTHLEFFWDGRRMVFGEVAHRIGGGWISEMLTGYLGKTPQELLVRSLQGAPPLPSPSGNRFVSAINLAPRSNGVVARIASPAKVRGTPGVLSYTSICKPGDVVDDLHVTASRWFGYIVFEHQNARQGPLIAADLSLRFAPRMTRRTP